MVSSSRSLGLGADGALGVPQEPALVDGGPAEALGRLGGHGGARAEPQPAVGDGPGRQLDDRHPPGLQAREVGQAAGVLVDPCLPGRHLRSAVRPQPRVCGGESALVHDPLLRRRQAESRAQLGGRQHEDLALVVGQRPDLHAALDLLHLGLVLGGATRGLLQRAPGRHDSDHGERSAGAPLWGVTPGRRGWPPVPERRRAARARRRCGRRARRPARTLAHRGLGHVLAEALLGVARQADAEGRQGRHAREDGGDGRRRP